MYESGSKIAGISGNINIVSGRNVNITRNVSTGFIFSGRGTHLFDDPNNKTFSNSAGVVLFGSESSVYVSNKFEIADEEIPKIDHHNTGFIVVGTNSDIWSYDSWKNVKHTVGDKEFTSGWGIQNSGILCAPRDCTLSLLGSNYGVTITGGGTVLDKINNNGVFITGGVYRKSQALFDKNHNRVSVDGTAVDHQDISSGAGIYIRGVVYDPTKNEIVGQGIIQLSNSTTFPILLKGEAQLDSTFNLKDTTGKYIIKNGVRQN